MRGRFGGDAAFASLQVAPKAPDLPQLHPMGGKQFKFALADALKKGRWSSISIRPHSRRLHHRSA